MKNHSVAAQTNDEVNMLCQPTQAPGTGHDWLTCSHAAVG